VPAESIRRRGQDGLGSRKSFSLARQGLPVACASRLGAAGGRKARGNGHSTADTSSPCRQTPSRPLTGPRPYGSVIFRAPQYVIAPSTSSSVRHAINHNAPGGGVLSLSLSALLSFSSVASECIPLHLAILSETRLSNSTRLVTYRAIVNRTIASKVTRCGDDSLHRA
jgi:hypothetical protein